MKKVEKWVLVANSSSARLFKLETLQKLTELQDFVHPESRIKEQDLVDEKPGRSFESTSLHRHGMQPRHTQREHEQEEFARKISDYLEEAYAQASFQELYLVASPNFLGLLRQTLKRQVLGTIVKEVSKDVVHLSTSEILKQIVE